MPANSRHQALQTPASPVSKPPTAKYTNKDGTKTITVPKSSASTPPAQPSPTTTSSSKGGAPANPNASVTSADDPPAAQIVNRKKQKRRAKAAAKAAAAAEVEEAEEEIAVADGPNGLPSPPVSTISAPPLQPSKTTPRKNSRTRQHAPPHHSQSSAHNDEYWDETESDDDHHLHYHDQQLGHPHTNGSMPQSSKPKKKKKQKGSAGGAVSALASQLEQASGISKEKIWNTSSQEERERIKQFWLGLGEDERKSLVKVEKDAVLKKMKEQQKHTCSCTVCGRKRTAIEEELEGLYDAYYEELESFANQPHNHPHGPPMLGGPRRLGQMTGLHPPPSVPTNFSNHHPSRGRIVEHVDNDDDDEEEVDEEYSDEDDLDEDDDGEPEDIPEETNIDFFNFGQSLTVQGGILTVADDLLKNDGRKFIEMMEQLAERRMAREEDAKDHYSAPYGHAVNGNSLPPSHNHLPPDDEDYDEEEEEDEDYDSQEEEYDEEEDTMTEEQRMEEGRRMFQIFAARMFEQRVLTAYKEKVAKERQQKLLEELEDESRQESQKKAKKAREAQKRKDKAAQKKQALAEEKARRDAEKAAEEAERLAEEKRRAEEVKAKAEEKRRKKEMQKRAEEEERLRKEAERQRRAHEAKERQAEHERKSREAKERERKLKEEQRIKEKEARELKERETRERREKHEQDKRDKEHRAAQAKAERDAKEKHKHDEKAAQKAASLVAPIPIPIQPAKKQQLLSSTPALPQQPLTNHASPQIAVATPALPKAPTPMKPRTVSQEVTRSVSQASHSGSGTSQNASPYPLTPAHNSPGSIGHTSKMSFAGSTNVGPPGLPTSPIHAHAGIKSPPGLGQTAFPMGMPPMGMHFPPGMPMGPGFNQMHNPIFPPMGGNFRPPPGGMPLPPPGLGGPIGRGFPMPHPPPGFQPGIDSMPGVNHGFPMPEGIVTGQPPSHSRQTSTSFEANPLDPKNSTTPAQPIARPIPIGRPASVVHNQRHNLDAAIDDFSSHLGSSALLDDSDEPFEDVGHQQRRNTTAPGSRPTYTTAPFMDPVFGSPMSHGWGAQPSIFAPPPGLGNSAWPPHPSFGGPPPSMRHAQPRSVAVRQMLCRACKDLENNAADADGYITLSAIKGHVDSINTIEPVSEGELLDMCDTEGNPQNGGGSFTIRHDEFMNKVSIRFDAASGTPPLVARNIGAPGEIGSPIVGSIGSLGARGS